MRLVPRLLLLATSLHHRRFDESEKTDAGVLEQRRKDHDEAGDEEDVDALEIRDLGK